MEDEPVIAYIDGSARGNPGPAGIGVVIFDRENSEEPIAEISRYIGITTNNVAEYEALIYTLKWLNNNQMSKAKIKLDSELVFKQINGEYRVKKPHLIPLINRVINLLNRFEKINFEVIPRQENKKANHLAQKASKKFYPSRT